MGYLKGNSMGDQVFPTNKCLIYANRHLNTLCKYELQSPVEPHLPLPYKLVAFVSQMFFKKPFSSTKPLCRHTSTLIYFRFCSTCSKFRLSYCPLRLNTFSNLLKGIFGEDARHQVFGDFEPLGQVELPAYYVHMIWKPTNANANGLGEWSVILSVPSSECHFSPSYVHLFLKRFFFFTWLLFSVIC